MSAKLVRIFALSAIIATGLATTPAAAKPKAVTVTGTVSDVVRHVVDYRDLNLASAAGEQALVRRVHYAVNDVCLEAIGGRVGYLKPTLNCQSATWSGTQPQVERAVQRARDIAANGWSAIAPVAIAISIR
jgi:UrcA family protein